LNARLWEVFTSTQEFVLAAESAIPYCLTAAQRQEFFQPPDPPIWCIELKKWPYQTEEWVRWLADSRAGKNPPLQSQQ
jgi:hypothetical protein